MNTEIKVALIAAIVALITSLISAYFSYINSKGQSKLKKGDALAEFLKSKINRLESELLKFNPKEKVDLTSMALSIIQTFENRAQILSSISHYLPENELDKLLEKKELISKSIAIKRAEQEYGSEVIKEDVGKLVQTEKILPEVIEFNKNSELLLRKELKNAVKKLESIYG